MIKFKNSKLSKKEEKAIINILYEINDVFGDFYITKDNQRLYIRENKEFLFRDLERGDYIAYNERGMGIVVGFAEKTERKFLKMLAKDNKIANELMLILLSEVKDEIYIKVKKNNPLLKIFEYWGFEWLAGRGSENLYIRRKQN